MASVKISVNGKTYSIDCGDGQEDRITELATYIDEQLSEIKKGSGAMAEDQLFVITTLILADEIHELMENPSTTVSDKTPVKGMIAEEKVSAIIEEVSNRLSSITKEVQAL